ncbi:hypothetical protein RND81_13G147900 [Saponaria officinalis]|uniref:FAR1 domain-containing protein n=1 Tax=Saponaria officinalis TaxID=3572 RepID=A0AAW1GXZ2_SAPOF
MVFNFDLNLGYMPIEETCTGTEASVGEKEFTDVLLGVEGDEFCRIVESQFTPFIGQEFLNLEEVVRFYKMYALACWFDVRRYTTKNWRDGTVKSKLLVCNRQGFKYGTVKSRKGSGRRMLSNKTLAVAKAVKPKRMCSNCKQMVHHDKRNCPNHYAEFLFR